MGVDEARDDDVAGRVDHLRVGGREVPADLGNPVVLDEHVGAVQLAECVVLRQDDASLDEDPFGHDCAPFYFRRAGNRWVCA